MGDKVLILRPEPEASDYAAELEAQGLSCMLSPMLELREVAFEVPDLNRYAGLLLTSAQAVRYFMRKGLPADIPVLCVGKHTAQAAREAGFLDVKSLNGTGCDLAAYVSGLPDAQNASFLHIHGRDVAYDIADDLMDSGITVDELVVYEALQVKELPVDVCTALRARDVGIVTFFSKRTAEAFVECVRRAGLEEALCGIKSLSISSSVLECVRIYEWADTYVSETPDRAGMLKVLEEIQEKR